jgi:hypothetical protein
LFWVIELPVTCHPTHDACGDFAELWCGRCHTFALYLPIYSAFGDGIAVVPRVTDGGDVVGVLQF